jgi:hypothetical protein
MNTVMMRKLFWRIDMWQDFSFIVQCNKHPAIRINVVARSLERAQEYAKDAYASQYAIYADDGFNKWSIKEV